jgi:hypothetical protein
MDIDQVSMTIPNTTSTSEGTYETGFIARTVNGGPSSIQTSKHLARYQSHPPHITAGHLSFISQLPSVVADAQIVLLNVN